MLETVLVVYMTLYLKPPTNAQDAARGSTAAVSLRTSSWLIHSVIFSSI